MPVLIVLIGLKQAVVMRLASAGLLRMLLNNI